MQKTVFISSTFQDLAVHRRAVWSMLDDFDVNVRGMEQFGARKEAPLDTCIAEVEQSDIYVGIVAFRLGSIDDATGKSFTQLEYERAYVLGRDILIYLIDEDNAEVKAGNIDRGKRWDKLVDFKRTLKERHTIDTFVSQDDLVDKLRRDLERRLEGVSGLQSLSKDQFNEASGILQQFLLVPRAISGREVALKIVINGDPLPASREVCEAFNFEFGATVGFPISIVQPEGFEKSGLTHIFMTAKQISSFMPFKKGEHRLVYTKLQFVDKSIEKIGTRFKSETRTTMPYFPFDDGLTTTVHLKAEGKIILVLTEDLGVLKDLEQQDQDDTQPST